VLLTERGRQRLALVSASLPGIWRSQSRSEELVVQALTAREFYQRDKQYVIQDGKIVIVDEFTGRLMPNRTWRQGMHQAVEAREQVALSDPVKPWPGLVSRGFSGFSGT